MWESQWKERKEREAREVVLRRNLEMVYMRHFDQNEVMDVRIGDAYQVRAQPQLRDHGWIDPKITELRVFKGTLLNIATDEQPANDNYENDDINRYTSIFKEAAIESVLANLRLEVKDYRKNFEGEMPALDFATLENSKQQHEY